MRRAARALTALVAAGALALTSASSPAAAAAAPEVVEVRDVLVVDVVSGSDTRPAHYSYDSAAGTAPVVAPSPVPGGVRLARPAGTTPGPVVELLPAEGAPLAVGTVEGIRGRWTEGTPRPVPVLRFLTPVASCGAAQSTPPATSSRLVVHDVEHDAAGAVVRLSASWQIPCSVTNTTATGELRYRSAAHYSAATSFGTELGPVTSGSRTPFVATVRNTGSVPLELGAPTAVPGGPSAPRLELTADGDGCSAAPLPVGASCTLALEHVDDGVPGGGYLAELRLPAPALARGYVAVLASVSQVVVVPRPVTGLRATGAYDGVQVVWNRAASPEPDGWRVRRVDGATPVDRATLPSYVVSWVDTSLAKGESASYEVVAFTAAGEATPVRVTAERQDRPEPPPALERRTLVMDGVTRAGVADSAAGTTVRVFDMSFGTTAVTAPAMVLHLPRLSGAGTFPVGPGPGQLPVLAYAPAATCGSATGTAEVREAWVRADGVVHRLDADLHLQCSGVRLEVALRVGTETPFTAVTTSPSTITDLQGVVHAAPAARTVSVRNDGTAPVDLGAPTVTGADAAAFSASSGTCAGRLEPGAGCALDVGFAPLRSGDHQAALTLPLGTAVGARVLSLKGSSVGPPSVRVPEAQAVLGRTLVRWSAGEDGGAPVTGVEVQRADEDGPFAAVAVLPASARSWVDEQASPGRRHRYRLVTTNRYGSLEPTPSQAVEVTGAEEELLAAVATSDDGPAELASLPVGGGQPVPLAAGQDVDLPAVSPDGASTAHVVHDEDGDSGLWLRPTAGTVPAPRVLVDEPGVDETDPAWSPDGTQVCYSRLAPDADAVWCIGTVAGAVPAAVPGGADAVEPSWLPDGSALVVTDVGSETTSLARVTPDGRRSAVPGTVDGRWPTVSPAGDRIAFVVTDDDGVDHLRTVPVAGGTPTGLAQTDELYDRPSWSPDGRRLAVPTLGLRGAPEVTVWTAADGTSPARVDRHRAAAGSDVLAVAWRRQDRAAPTITFPGAPARSAGQVRLPVRIADDTVPVAGLQVSCRIDGREVGRCAGGWTGTLPAGSHRLDVVATDAHGRTSTAAHAFTVDTTPPAVSVAALPAFVLAGPVTLAYAASDASGVASYDVRHRRAAFDAPGFSPLTVPVGWASTTARSRSLQLAPGHEHCLSVRARDRVGNLSAWSAERCTAAPLDDRALTRVTAGWTSSTSPTALAGTLTRTSTAGARLSRPSAHARRIAVVATTCPTCGTVEVLVAGRRIGTLSLVSPTSRARQVLSLPVQATVRSGTVTLRSTRTGRPVLVDGLGLRRT